MHTLETSAKPRMRSEVALLNSAASRSPRSIAGTISPPGSAFTAAPRLVPGEQHVGVHSIRGTRPPERQGVLLPVVVHEDAMATVERALRHGVDQAEGRDHRAGRQHVDLEVAAGHVVDLLGEVERVLVEDVLLRPGAATAW